MQIYKDEVDEESKFKPRMFTYPDFKVSSTVFDYDDLADDSMIVLCVRENPNDEERAKSHYLFIWTGEYFENNQDMGAISKDEFIEKVKEQYWGNTKGIDIEVMDEIAGDESEEFSNFVY